MADGKRDFAGGARAGDAREPSVRGVRMLDGEVNHDNREQ
jgi:hypothetical protein